MSISIFYHPFENEVSNTYDLQSVPIPIETIQLRESIFQCQVGLKIQTFENKIGKNQKSLP